MSAKASAPRQSFTGNGGPPEELAQRAEQTGKEDIAPCTPFVSAVFNFDQVEGVARPADRKRVSQWYRAWLLSLRRWVVSPLAYANGTQSDAGGFIPRGPSRWLGGGD